MLWAARLTILLVLAGLALVGYSVWRHYGPGELSLNCTATFVFIAAWAVAQSGIWDEATAAPRNARRGGWLRTAAAHSIRWFGSFMLISVLAGQLIKQTEVRLPSYRGGRIVEGRPDGGEE
ncbi:hypothetical protein ACFOS0_01850, partial [Nocardia seriolae]